MWQRSWETTSANKLDPLLENELFSPETAHTFLWRSPSGHIRVALLAGFLGRVAKKTCIAHQHENTTLVSHEALPTRWLKIYSE